MKLLAILYALVIQCAATKSWNNDSYLEETYSVFGWIGYLKRWFLITLMLSGVVLYYVPESRPYARRICYTLIDITANGLKFALSARESEYMYEKIKSKYQQARCDPSFTTSKRIGKEIRNDGGDFGICARTSYNRKPKIISDCDDILGIKEKKKTNKSNKEHRHSRHHFRNSTIKDISGKSSVDLGKSIYYPIGKFDSFHKYLAPKLSDGKRSNMFLISGSPQQMAMLDSKFDKDDVVIVQDPYVKVEYKECGTTTDKLSSKAEVSSSDQEGPTRDYENHITDSGMETYVKEVELNSMQDVNTSRYSVSSLRRPSQYHCGGECCGVGECFMSSEDLTNRVTVSMSPVDIKNVLKSSGSMMITKPHKNAEDHNEDLLATTYSSYNRQNWNNSRKVDFRKEDLNDNNEIPEKGNERKYESTCKVHRKRFTSDETITGYSCNDVYYTDKGGEADDETSQHGVRPVRKLELDEKPQRENLLYREASNESLLDYREYYTEPILKNRLKPALTRAVNWIFGGCPEASRRTNNEVGKEEHSSSADGWLLPT